MEKPLLLLRLPRSTDIHAAIDAASAVGKRVAARIAGSMQWIILREPLS
jgi:hypothetical protein